MKIARDGWTIIGFAGFMALGSLFFVPEIMPFLLMLTIFLLWFFRDPERKIQAHGTGKEFISPADGKVVEVERSCHPYTGPAWKIGIFMSVTDVHVNRAPFSGEVDYLEYVPGKNLMAFRDKASEENERMYVGFKTDEGPVLTVQIAGFLARRIVCRLKKGMFIDKGQRFGMIKLGSKVDVLMPLSVKPLVEKGQRVSAGSTVIGVIDDENP